MRFSHIGLSLALVVMIAGCGGGSDQTTLAAFEDAAAHNGRLPRAVGGGCAPPKRGPGPGVWRCEATYQVRPLVRRYVLRLRDDGCWTATAVRVSVRSPALLRGCGVPVPTSR
jgi:hypothetical protein